MSCARVEYPRFAGVSHQFIPLWNCVQSHLTQPARYADAFRVPHRTPLWSVVIDLEISAALRIPERSLFELELNGCRGTSDSRSIRTSTDRHDEQTKSEGVRLTGPKPSLIVASAKTRRMYRTAESNGAICLCLEKRFSFLLLRCSVNKCRLEEFVAILVSVCYGQRGVARKNRATPKFSHFDRNSTEHEIGGALCVCGSMNHQPAIVSKLLE